MVDFLKNALFDYLADRRISQLQRECRLISQASYIDDGDKSRIILEYYKMIYELQKSKSNSTSN